MLILLNVKISISYKCQLAEKQDMIFKDLYCTWPNTLFIHASRTKQEPKPKKRRPSPARRVIIFVARRLSSEKLVHETIN